MPEEYRIHFGFSKSKRYQQALELASYAHKHEIQNSGPDIWHTLSFTEEQTDLMALIHQTTKGFRYPQCDGVDIHKLLIYAKHGEYTYIYDSPGTRERVQSVANNIMTTHNFDLSALATFIKCTYVTPIFADIKRVISRLASEGYLETHDPKTQSRISPTRKPKEHNPIYAEIRDYIGRGQYREAIEKYYEALGDKPYGELNEELLYLKRLGNIQLCGRDILIFKPESSRSDLIKANIWEYCSCIDSILAGFEKAGRRSLTEILIKSIPTLEELIQRKQEWFSTGIYLWEGELKRDTTRVTADFWGTFKVPKGRLFDRYPNVLIYHWDEEEAPDAFGSRGIWTLYAPSYVEEEILKKGFHLLGIAACGPTMGKRGTRKKAAVEFTSLTSLNDVEVSKYFCNGVNYTGRRHSIGGKDFYEIDVVKKAPWNMDRTFPSLGEQAEDVLRESENLLRKQHGLPGIGEGWVSEMRLYNLVKEIFPDAQHHVTPNWLKPQELDVYVPSRNLAFEYQGIQHYQSIDFFGGEDGFSQRQELDARKKRKCKSSGVVLIEWRFDEPIDRVLLTMKLEAVNVKIVP